MESDNRIEQAIGKVLGFPDAKDDQKNFPDAKDDQKNFPDAKDDQKNFPDAKEADGVCVGDHVAESLVMELIDKFKELEDKLQKQWEWSQCALDWRESEIIKARADERKKIATWIQKNDNHFIFHFIPECGGDFCFLATEGMENECAEPDEGAGHCQYRDKCRYANKQLLFGQNFIAKLQKGEDVECV